jgi:hypothetical protein
MKERPEPAKPRNRGFTGALRPGNFGYYEWTPGNAGFTGFNPNFEYNDAKSKQHDRASVGRLKGYFNKPAATEAGTRKNSGAGVYPNKYTRNTYPVNYDPFEKNSPKETTTRRRKRTQRKRGTRRSF